MNDLVHIALLFERKIFVSWQLPGIKTLEINSLFGFFIKNDSSLVVSLEKLFCCLNLFSSFYQPMAITMERRQKIMLKIFQ